MTMNEITKEYDGEWVLLEDPYDDDRDHVAGGKLIFHSLSRDAVYQEAIRRRPQNSAVLYMGPMPDDIFLNIPQIFGSNP